MDCFHNNHCKSGYCKSGKCKLNPGDKNGQTPCDSRPGFYPRCQDCKYGFVQRGLNDFCRHEYEFAKSTRLFGESCDKDSQCISQKCSEANKCVN